MISFGDDLPDEIVLEIIKRLLKHEAFLPSLSRFAQTSKLVDRISSDFTLWQHALNLYFPIVQELSHKDKYVKEDFQNKPLILFKHYYLFCLEYLKKNNMSFDDYINFVNTGKCADGIKLPTLRALSIAAGHHLSFEAPLTPRMKDIAFLFSAQFSNRKYILQRLSENPPIGRAFVQKSLVIVAKNGNLALTATLLAHCHAPADRPFVCEAFSKSCEIGHTLIADLFLRQPMLNMISFSLAPVFLSACARGDHNVANLLSATPSLNTNNPVLTQGLLRAMACNHNHIVAFLLQMHAVSNDDSLLNTLFKICVERSNIEILDLVLKFSDRLPAASISEAVNYAMNNHHEHIAHTILKSNLAKIRPYARRDLLVKAASNGYASLVALILTEDKNNINAEVLGKALRSAVNNHQDEVRDYILRNSHHKMRVSDIEIEVTPTFCARRQEIAVPECAQLEQLCDELKKLNVNEPVVLFEPQPVLKVGFVNQIVKDIEARRKHDSTTGQKQQTGFNL